MENVRILSVFSLLKTHTANYNSTLSVKGLSQLHKKFTVARCLNPCVGKMKSMLM